MEIRLLEDNIKINTVNVNATVAAKDTPYYISTNTMHNIFEYVYNIIDSTSVKYIESDKYQIVLDKKPYKLLKIEIKKNDCVTPTEQIQEIINILLMNKIKINENIRFNLRILKSIKESSEKNK